MSRLLIKIAIFIGGYIIHTVMVGIILFLYFNYFFLRIDPSFPFTLIGPIENFISQSVSLNILIFSFLPLGLSILTIKVVSIINTRAKNFVYLAIIGAITAAILFSPCAGFWGTFSEHGDSPPEILSTTCYLDYF